MCAYIDEEMVFFYALVLARRKSEVGNILCAAAAYVACTLLRSTRFQSELGTINKVEIESLRASIVIIRQIIHMPLLSCTLMV